MAANVPSSFITQWADEVKHSYQQKGSKLAGCVRRVSGVVGSTHEFHTLGQVAATTKVRDADVVALNPTQATRVATLADAYGPIYLDKLDEVKTNADFRREYVMTAASAIGRNEDDVIIAAMAATPTSIPSGVAGLTYDKILGAIELLNDQDVEMEDRFMVIGPRQMTDALGIQQLTSSDFLQVQAVMKGQVDSALGLQWKLSTRLPLAAAERSCFVFDKYSIGEAVGMDITTEVNYIPEKVSYLINSFHSVGAVVIEDAGMIEVLNDES